MDCHQRRVLRLSRVEWSGVVGEGRTYLTSECYLSGYHPTQSYLSQPHPTLDSSTSLPCSTPSNHLVSCHPTQWNHILPGPVRMTKGPGPVRLFGLRDLVP